MGEQAVAFEAVPWSFDEIDAELDNLRVIIASVSPASRKRLWNRVNRLLDRRLMLQRCDSSGIVLAHR